MVFSYSWCALERCCGWDGAPPCPSPLSSANLEVLAPRMQTICFPGLWSPAQRLPPALPSPLVLWVTRWNTSPEAHLEPCVYISWVSPYRVKSSLMGEKGSSPVPFTRGMLVWSCLASGQHPYPYVKGKCSPIESDPTRYSFRTQVLLLVRG